MKSLLLRATAVFALSFGSTYAASPSAPLTVTVTSNSGGGTGVLPGSILPPGTWKNSFDDEFPGTSINTSNWTVPPSGSFTPGFGSSDCTSTESVTVNNGLTIKGTTASQGNSVGCNIYTNATFGFGYYETKMWTDPVGWSGFWIWDQKGECGTGVIGGGTLEVDIIETNAPGGTQNIYWGGYGGAGTCPNSFHGQGNNHLAIGDTYHIYGLDLEPTGFTWYIDGTQTANYSYNFPNGTMAHPQYINVQDQYNNSNFASPGVRVAWVRFYHH